MFFNKTFLLSIIIFLVLIFFVTQFLSPNNFSIKLFGTNSNTTETEYEKNIFQQVIVKKFAPIATPETNIELIATSTEDYILQVCAKNPTSHYDSLDIMRGDQELTHLDLVNDTDYICTKNTGNAGDDTNIITADVSGVTTLIVTLKTYANATASITYPE